MKRSALALGVVGFSIFGLAASADGSKPSAPYAPCRATIPHQRAIRTDEGSFNYGTHRLAADLFWPRGVLPAGLLPSGASYATVNRDGSIYTKVGWWRGVRGKLAISGRRLDARAAPLRSDVPSGYGPKGFQASGLTFPTVGCWRVVGVVGSSRLAFVVKVMKIAKGFGRLGVP